MEVPNIKDLKKEDIIGVWENMSIISNSSPDAFIPKMGERTSYTFLKNNKYRFESRGKFQEGEWCLEEKVYTHNKMEFFIVLDEKLEHIITSIKRDELEWKADNLVYLFTRVM